MVSSWRLARYVAVAVIVAAGLLVGSGGTARSDTTDWVANPAFAHDTSSWTVSSGGRLSAFESSGVTYGQLRTRNGKKTVSMTSDPSDKLLPRGATVTTSLRVRTPKPRVTIGIQARELDQDGNVVASTAWKSSKDSRRWRSATVRLEPQGEDHRYSLRITAYSMSESRSVRVRAIETTVVPATSPSPSPAPTPSPTSSPLPTSPPTSSGTPTAGWTHGSSDVRPCTTTQIDELDYSRPEQGQLAWADEFDGSGVDTARWRVRNETTLSFDQARIMAANVGVGDGMLSITARREDAGGRAFTTGYLDTIGKFSRQYGRWEIRAKLPTKPEVSRGLWPAFWLRADQLPGEIDVMEAWGDPASRTYNSLTRSYAWTVHENTNSPDGSRRFGGWGVLDRPIADDFHVWSVDWSPECLKFSMDGVSTGSVATSSAPWLAANLDGPVNIRLNMQIGSSYWGYADLSKPEDTVLPATYVVDYVRVYRPVD